jgi:peptidyl-dipeptidase A
MGKSSILAALVIAAAAAAVRADTTPTAADAAAFVAQAEKELAELSEFSARVAWVNATYITEDTDWLSARVGTEFTELGVKYAKEAARFDTVQADPDVRRKLMLLKLGLVLPAPSTEGAALELNEIATRLQSMYGKGKGTLDGQPIAGTDIEEKMGTVRDPAKLQEMWVSWHDNVGRPMRRDYARLVEIANAGAKELGFPDLGALWRSGYDMPPDDFARLTDRLWNQVKPLYDELHCYARGKLNEKYGDAVQKKTGPIRADLLGNMWAQEWGNINDIVAPPGQARAYDLTQLLEAKNYKPLDIIRTGESFFSSLGFAPLPETFWQRSMFTKPADREVVCHASAWDIDNKDDLRIKMCTKVNADDFVTVHHELGHNYYQRAYNQQPFLFLGGANDGFHEAIGDFIALSVTPEYLVQIGLLDASGVPPASADTALLLSQAMDKIAFLPFGLLMDKWRWQVFSGAITPADYNAGWWKLRSDYQGIAPPVARSEADFDPGAKFHIPGNTPYTRYFLARILQFQFHRAACEMAGWQGPLHRCSIYGNRKVGERLDAMMRLGLSRPWPEALETFTGSREIDAGAIIAYFQPLMGWLRDQNKGMQCGW